MLDVWQDLLITLANDLQDFVDKEAEKLNLEENEIQEMIKIFLNSK